MVFPAEDMRVVLDEGAGPHQPLPGTRRLVAMDGAELEEPQRQIAEGADALIEDLDMTGAAHRLQRQRAPAVVEREHRVAELLPMAARLPERARHQLRALHLAISRRAHAPADIARHDLIEREAARVPEHHPRRLLLLMEEVHAIADGAMISLVHARLPFAPETSRARTCEGPVRRRRGLGWSLLPRSLAQATSPRPAKAGRRRGRRGDAPHVHGGQVSADAPCGPF